MSIIELNNSQIGHSQYNVALRDVSLTIYRGEKTAILGQSGGGKTALLQHLFHFPNLDQESAFYMQQDLGLIEQLTVFHNVYMGRLSQLPTWYNLLNLFIPQTKMRHAILPILQKLGIAEKENTVVKQLSGGQQQRVIVARALFSRTATLFADEPITGLDQKQSNDVLTLLLNSFQTSVIVLHDVELALQHFDRIIGLKNGKVYLNELSQNLTAAQLHYLYQ